MAAKCRKCGTQMFMRCDHCLANVETDTCQSPLLSQPCGPDYPFCPSCWDWAAFIEPEPAR